MTRILPLLSRAENRRLLVEWLRERPEYEVVDPAFPDAIDEPFDLCILDGSSLRNYAEELRARKDAERPVFLPFLVVAPGREIPGVDADAWRTVDGVVRRTVDAVVSGSPISKPELRGRMESLLHRRRATRELHESEERYRSLTDDVLDESDVGHVVVGPDDRVVWVNRTVERYFGVAREELLGGDRREIMREHKDAFEEADRVESRLLDAYERGAPLENVELHVLGGEERSERWINHWGQPIESGLYAGGRAEHYADITNRKRREQTIRTLHRTTRELMQADTEEQIGEVVVEAMRDIVEFPVVCLYRWSEADGNLHPATYTENTVELVGSPPTLSGGESPVWDAFVDGETRRYEDVRDVETALEANAPIRGALVVPLGHHGAIICGSTTEGVDEAHLDAAEVLAANATAALDRADREAVLRTQERQLQDQNERLTELNRINTVTRKILRTIVSASTRGEIERAVCAQLVDVDQYEFAWIGSAETADGAVAPRAWAGDESGYLDHLVSARDAADDAAPLPIERAVRDREPQVVGNILTDPAFEPWRKAALNAGYRSAISIPLRFNGVDYGALEIYASRPAAFPESERAVLLELGDTVANALGAVERTRAFFTEGSVELEFDVAAADDVLFRLARRADCSLALDSVLPHPSGGWIVYASVSDADPESVLGVADQFVSVEQGQLVRSSDGDHSLELVVSDLALATVLGKHGTTLHSLRAGPDGGRVVVRLPQTADVRSFVDVFTQQFPDADLLARRQPDRSDEGPQLSPEAITNRLTDRQRETLQVAYQGGFFAWPRESTGEEIAERLDIAAPTFHQHVRKGMERILDAIFD